MNMLQILLWPLILTCAVSVEKLKYNHPKPFATNDNGVVDYYNTTIESLRKDGSVAWRFDAEKAIETAAVSPDGAFVVGTSNGTLYALSTKDGSLRWTFAAQCNNLPHSGCFSKDAIQFDYKARIYVRTAGYNDLKSTPQPGVLYVLLPVTLNNAAGQLLWSANVHEFPQQAGMDVPSSGSPLIGFNSTEDYVFVLSGIHGANIDVLNRENGSVAWSVAGVADEKDATVPMALKIDGSLVVRAGQTIRQYFKDGTQMWSYNLPKDTDAYAIMGTMDGSVYVNFAGTSQNPTVRGLLALSPEGMFKWQITGDWDGVFSAPSDFINTKGDVLVTKTDKTGAGGVELIHSDGTHSPFYTFNMSYNTAEISYFEEWEKSGGIFVTLGHVQPGAAEAATSAIAVLQSNGDEKLAFWSSSGPAVAYADDTIYVKRTDRRDYDPQLHPYDTYVVVQVDPSTGYDKWEHVLSRPLGCEENFAGKECFKGFCRVPENNWTAPPPACKKYPSSEYCCKWIPYSVPQPPLEYCNSMCLNNTNCVAFDFGPSNKECCLFASPGAKASITGAYDNQTIRGCWVKSPSGRFPHESEIVV